VAERVASSREGPRPIRVVDIIELSTSADTLLKARVLALRASGIDNRIVCIDGPRIAALRAQGIPVHTVHLPRNLNPFRLAASLIELAAYLRRSPVDVVHTHGSIPGVVGRLAAWLTGVPVIVHTVHGFHFHERTSWLARLPHLTVERLCGLVTDTLLTQNRGDLEQAERFGIGPQGRRHHIGSGVDLQRFRPEDRGESTEGLVTVTCVARLEPVKNHGMLFAAAANLARRGTRFRLKLVGDGRLRAEYQHECARLGIDGLVEFLGYRHDLPDILAITDIAVLTSEQEVLPRAVLEAMAMGIPVVATRVPGTREVVRHNETGLAVELGDAAGLADALALLIGDPALRARMGGQGHRVATAEFDERSLVDALRQLYESRPRARSAAAPGEVSQDRVAPAPPGSPASSGGSPATGGNALRVGRNALFLMAAQVVYALFNVAAMVLLGNSLAAKGYGEYAFYYAFIPLIASVCDVGTGIIVMRGIARDHSSGPRLLGDALLIKAAVAGFILLVGVGGAWAMLDPARAILITIVTVGALIAHGLDPAIWVFRAREKLHLEALMLLLSLFLWLPLLIAGIMTKAGMPGLLAALVLASGVRFATGAWIVSKRLYRPEFRLDPARLRGLLVEGLPFGAAMFGTVLYGQVGLLMLKGFATAADVAYFNVAFMLSQPITFIAMVFGIAVFPMVARDARGNEQALRRDLTLNFKWQVLFSVPLMVGLFLLARPVVSLLFRGRDFQPAATGLAVTSLGLVVFFLNISYRYVLAALDRQRQFFHAILAGLAANAVLCAILIPRLGYLGACAAYLGAEATILIVCHHALSKHVRLREFLVEAVKPLAAGVGMGLLLLAFRGTNIFVRVAIGCVSYPALLFLLRAFTAEEMRALQRIYASFGLPGAALFLGMEPPSSGEERVP